MYVDTKTKRYRGGFVVSPIALGIWEMRTERSRLCGKEMLKEDETIIRLVRDFCVKLCTLTGERRCVAEVCRVI
jgi:hypothetical protein